MNVISAKNETIFFFEKNTKHMKTEKTLETHTCQLLSMINTQQAKMNEMNKMIIPENREFTQIPDMDSISNLPKPVNSFLPDPLTRYQSMRSENYQTYQSNQHQPSNYQPAPLSRTYSTSTVNTAHDLNNSRLQATSEARLQTQQLALTSVENKLQSSQDTLIEKRGILKELTFKCHDTQRALNNAEDELKHLLLKIEEKKQENSEIKRINSKPDNSVTLKELEESNNRLQTQMVEERKKQRLSVCRLEEQIEEMQQQVDEVGEENLELKDKVKKYDEEDVKNIQEKYKKNEDRINELMKDHESQLKIVQETSEMNSKTRIDKINNQHELFISNLKSEIKNHVEKISSLETSQENKLENKQQEIRSLRNELLDMTKKYQESSTESLLLQQQIKLSTDELGKIRGNFEGQIEMLAGDLKLAKRQVIDVEVEKKELKNENVKFASEIENIKFLHEQEIAEIRQRTQKMMTEQREAAKKESSDEIEKYRGKLQEIEQSVRMLRKDRDDLHNKNKDLSAELSTLKSSILPAVHTEATRILQHAKKLAPDGYNEKCKTDSVAVSDGGSQFSPDNVQKVYKMKFKTTSCKYKFNDF